MKKLFAYAGASALATLAALQSAQAAVGDLIAIDPTKEGMEAVTFSPGAIVQPVILIIGTVIMSVAAIWLITLGIKWLLKFLKGAR